MQWLEFERLRWDKGEPDTAFQYMLSIMKFWSSAAISLRLAGSVSNAACFTRSSYSWLNQKMPPLGLSSV